MSRKDKRLVDCFLSNRGVREAHGLRSNGTLQRCTFDLVCTSPLTRAVATCVLALGHITEREMKNSAGGVATTPFLAHPCISEAGTIPENTGREIPVLKKDLKKKLSLVCPSSSDCIDHIDFSLVPNSWPLVDDSGKSEKKRKLDIFLKWLMEREEKNIAVVCHYHIIRWILDNAIDHVPNCMPIECVLLDGTARLVLKSDYESGNIAIKKGTQTSKNKSRKI